MSAIDLVQDTPKTWQGWGCVDCKWCNSCLPSGLDSEQTGRLSKVIVHNRHVERHGALIRAGQPFRFLYAIRHGFVKGIIGQADGRDQVTGVYMPGEIVGMDGIGGGIHKCDLVALEDSNICAIPFVDVERLSREIPALERRLHSVLSRELVRGYEVMFLLGSMHIEERVALFLLNLSQRYAANGGSATQFNLLLTRDEIGSYLGARLETVSRVLSRFQDDGLIAIQHKDIVIKDLERLIVMLSSYVEKDRSTSRRAPRIVAKRNVPMQVHYA